MILLKCCTQYASKFGKLSSGHRTGKAQSSIPIPKKGSAKECSNYWQLLSSPMLVKLCSKSSKARLLYYVNWELPDVQTGFRKGRGTRDQVPKICWIIEKAREFQKNIYLCFINYIKAFNCVDHNKVWKTLIEMGMLLLLLLLSRFRHVRLCATP